jgi:predicted transcriptional regulator
MTKYKVQSHKALFEEMKSVARGEKEAPADAGLPSVESAEVLLRLLTKENRELLRMIRDQKPESVADLARMSHRAQPNLLRTLNKLEAFGLIEMRTSGKRRMPVTKVKRLSVRVDPYSLNDRLEIA